MKNRDLKAIEPAIKQFISDKQLYVLRDAKTGNALNCSYTVDGLKWTTNASGKLIFFNDARFERVSEKRSKYHHPITHVRIVGDTTPSDKVYVEHFVPTDRNSVKGQVAEYTWTDKAYRLLYHTV